MATKNVLYLSLADWASKLGPDGKYMPVIEQMNLTNPVLDDMMFKEANGSTGHKSAIRTGIPLPTWRRLYGGVLPTKARQVQVTDTIGMLANYSKADAKLVRMAGDRIAARADADRPYIEGFSQEMAYTLFYGNTNSDPEEFMGLAPRYDDLGGENARNIIDCGGSGSTNASIWIVCWAEDTCFGIFPKGEPTGLQITDKGLLTMEDGITTGALAEFYVTHYEWDMGLVLADWRYVARLANIDVALLDPDCATGANLVDKLVIASHRLPNMKGRPVIYCNEDVFTYLDLQVLNRSNVWLSYGQDLLGQRVLTFRGIPIKKCQSLLSTEAAVA